MMRNLLAWSLGAVLAGGCLAACSLVIVRDPGALQSLGNHMPACMFFCEQAASPTRAEGGNATGAKITQTEGPAAAASGAPK